MKSLIKNTIILVILTLFFPSCNNTNDCMDSVSLSRSSRGFNNGECVLAAVYYSAHFVGCHIPEEEIRKYFKDMGVAVDEEGNLKGYKLNTQDWYEVFQYFLGGQPAGIERRLLEELDKGNIASCRTYDRSHAFILVSYNEATNRFKYYDPILNIYETVHASLICDVVIIKNRINN